MFSCSRCLVLGSVACRSRLRAAAAPLNRRSEAKENQVCSFDLVAPVLSPSLPVALACLSLPRREPTIRHSPAKSRIARASCRDCSAGCR
jgi:hypothetical protein